jgi:hypothetical protein
MTMDVWLHSGKRRGSGEREVIDLLAWTGMSVSSTSARGAGHMWRVQLVTLRVCYAQLCRKLVETLGSVVSC